MKEKLVILLDRRYFTEKDAQHMEGMEFNGGDIIKYIRAYVKNSANTPTDAVKTVGRDTYLSDKTRLDKAYYNALVTQEWEN